MGLTMRQKKAVTRETTARYQKASKKEKQGILDEFVKLTGYHRKYAIRVFGTKPVKQVTICQNGETVLIKPEKKKRVSNRRGRRKYNEEVISVLRLLWVFFRFKCGKIIVRRNSQKIASIVSQIKYFTPPPIPTALGIGFFT